MSTSSDIDIKFVHLTFLIRKKRVIVFNKDILTNFIKFFYQDDACSFSSLLRYPFAVNNMYKIELLGYYPCYLVSLENISATKSLNAYSPR